MPESDIMKEKIFVILAKKAAMCGLSNISLNTIAKEAGIKKPSLYNYWKSRDEMIHEFFIFWGNLLLQMSQSKQYLLPRKDILQQEASVTLLRYANRGFTLFSSSPFQEVFIVMDTEKYINPQAAKLFQIFHKIIFDNMKEVLADLNIIGKMNILDIESATSLLASSFLEHVRILVQSKQNLSNSSLSQRLITHFVQLYQ